MPNKEKQKPPALHGVYNKFLHLDMFAQAQSFEVEGERFYRTSIGSIMSILILIIIAPYVAKRINVLVDYRDTRYSTSKRTNKFMNDHSSPENGITFEEAAFKMAYGVTVTPTDLDLTGLQGEDWAHYVDIGLKHRWQTWNGTYFNHSSSDIPTHPCGDFTEEGFDEPNPIINAGIKQNYSIRTRCMDDQNKYKLFGKHSNTDKVGTIQLELTACDPNARADPSTCEPDEAKVTEYLENNHLVINIIHNFINYNTEEY